jgi:hypothetical protein
MYMADQPEETYFYLYSDQWPFRLETRQYLAPDAEGEDRSTEFSGVGGSIEGLDRSRPASLVLLPQYAPLLDAIERRYPGGTVREFRRHGDLMFFAYEIPSDGSRPARIQGP